MAELKDGDKWACKFCTYQNYAATQRCVMCGQGNARKNVGDGDLSSRIGRGNAPRSPTPENRLSATNAEISRIENFGRREMIGDKWICKSCTYHNFAATQRCAMCGHGNARKNVGGNDQSLRIGSKNVPRSPTPESRLTTANVDTPRIEHYGRNIGDKWICKICTYHNYASAMRCTMCANHRKYLVEKRR